MTNASPSEQLARINPDSKPVLYLVLAVTTVIAAVAFAVSFAGLAAVSQWAQIPPRLAWALPVFIDGAILGFTIMILVFRARGESTIFAWVVLIAFTFVSVAANGAHAYAEGAPDDWRTILGSGLAGLAPAGLAVFIHGIARLLVASPGTTAEQPSSVIPGHLGGRAEDKVPLRSSHLLSPPRAAQNGAAIGSGLAQSALPAKASSLHASTDVSGVSTPSSLNTASYEPRDVTEKVENDQEGLQQDAGAGNSQPSLGHPRKEQVDRAIALHREGMSQKAIGETIGVSRATIGRWIRTHRTRDSAGNRLVSQSTS